MSFGGGFFSSKIIGASGKKVLIPGTVSLNNINWQTFRDVGSPGVNINNLEVDNNIVIAVTSTGTIYTAPLGSGNFSGPFATPKALGLNGSFSNSLRAIAAGAPDGGQAYVITSDTHDGQNFIQRAGPLATGIYSIGFNPKTGLFMMVGDNDHMATSFDGITWTNISQAVFGASVCYSLLWFDDGTLKGRWIQGPGLNGLSANVATSNDDGVTWVMRGPTSANQAKYRFAYNINGNLAMAAGSTAAGAVHISPDKGATWQSFGAGAGADFIGVEAMPTGRFIFAGANRGDGKPRVEICDSNGGNVRVINMPINGTVNVIRYFTNRLYLVGFDTGPLIYSTTDHFF